MVTVGNAAADLTKNQVVLHVLCGKVWSMTKPDAPSPFAPWARDPVRIGNAIVTKPDTPIKAGQYRPGCEWSHISE